MAFFAIQLTMAHVVKPEVKMALSKNPSQYTARRNAAWQYASKGRTLHWIATQLEKDGLGKVSYVAVHKMLAKTRSQVVGEMTDKASLQIARQTAALWNLYYECVRSWDLSCVDDQGKRKAGNPRYLTAILQVLASIERIWRFAAPNSKNQEGKIETDLEAFVEAKRQAEYPSPPN